jgi:outer membrane protein TolC
MTRYYTSVWTILSGVVLLMAGCAPRQPFYFFEDGDLSHYKAAATEIEYPDVQPDRLADVDGALAPFSLKNSDPRNMELWDLSLEEAMRITMQNSKVVRTIGGQVVQPPALLSQSPDAFPTVYDPAIAESNPRIGVEAALAAFDAQLSSSLLWAKNDRPVNVAGVFGPLIFAPVFEQDLGQGTVQLSKTTATGGQFFLRENTNYEFNNNPTRLFPSDWVQTVEAEFRHPLLQGAGVTFNRIAGPNAQPGFFFANGVILARINVDIALADFEIAARTLVRDVETAYWELYFSYRNLDALIAGRDSALQTWRRVYALYVVSAVGGEAEKEAQAREQYFLFRAQVENALSQLYSVENRLRFLMGIAATDGRLIRPSDEPSIARINLDWYEIHAEALARNSELRRQKWRVKQRQMELIATRNFLLPRLDYSARYRWYGFGNDWWFANRSNFPFADAMQTLTGGKFQEWQMGLTFQMPIGFRRELAAVRNMQLLLARERSVLQDMELEISHQLSDAARNVDRYYGLSQTNFNRRVAAERNVDAVKAAYDTGTVTLDLVLDAQRRLADAESSYYRSLVDYMLAIRDVHLRKGSLLEYNGILLAEGPWPAKAYFDAMRRARERDAGLFINYGFTQPRVLSRGPYQQHIHGGTGALQGTSPLPREIPAEEVTPPAPQGTNPQSARSFPQFGLAPLTTAPDASGLGMARSSREDRNWQGPAAGHRVAAMPGTTEVRQVQFQTTPNASVATHAAHRTAYAAPVGAGAQY